MGKMKYIGPVVVDQNGAVHAPAGFTEGGGRFISVVHNEAPRGSLEPRHVAPSDLTPEAAPSVDAEAPVEDDITAVLERQNRFYRDAEKNGSNDRADVTSGDGISRFDKPQNGLVSTSFDTDSSTTATFVPVGIEPAALLEKVQRALIEFRDDIVNAEELVQWPDGRFGALITVRADDPDGHTLEYPNHPNHSDVYFADDSYEYAMTYRNRGLTKVYVQFD
jgi:hypothetical protein